MGGSVGTLIGGELFPFFFIIAFTQIKLITSVGLVTQYARFVLIYYYTKISKKLTLSMNRATWRAFFWVNASLAILAAIAIIITAPADKIDDKADRRVDWIGAALITVSLILLTFVLGEGEVSSKGWATPRSYPQLLQFSLSRLIYDSYLRYYCASDSLCGGNGYVPGMGIPFRKPHDTPSTDEAHPLDKSKG